MSSDINPLSYSICTPKHLLRVAGEDKDNNISFSFPYLSLSKEGCPKQSRPYFMASSKSGNGASSYAKSMILREEFKRFLSLRLKGC